MLVKLNVRFLPKGMDKQKVAGTQKKLMFNFTNNQNYKFQALSGTHFAELSLQNLGTEKSFSYCLRERASCIYVDKIDPTQGARNTCFYLSKIRPIRRRRGWQRTSSSSTGCRSWSWRPSSSSSGTAPTRRLASTTGTTRWLSFSITTSSKS